MTKLQKALIDLKQLTSQGVEYPDAEWKVSERYNLTRKDLIDLRADYDAPEEYDEWQSHVEWQTDHENGVV